MMAIAGRLTAASVFPLASLDPTAAFDDLEPLTRLIGDSVQVVAIGESVHAAHEYYALRHRLIRFLIERMNFTAVVWESGFPEGFLVDEYIQGAPLDRERVQIDGMTMHLGRCEEMGDLLDWLRAHNSQRLIDTNDKVAVGAAVRFYGLDLPGAGATLSPIPHVVAPYVESVDPGFHSRLARLQELATSLTPQTLEGEATSKSKKKLEFAGSTAVRQYMSMTVADRNELTALLADLVARFDSMRRIYVERSDVARYDRARQHLRVAAQLDVQLRAVAALMAGDTSACEGNIRDATMADTVEWILHREQRIVVLAHNGHIQRTPISTPAGTLKSVDTLGVHLAHRLGNRYLTIGTTCGGGEIIAMRAVTQPDGSYDSELYLHDLPPADPETIDTLLDTQLPGLSLLDLRTLDDQGAALVDTARKMRMQDMALDIDVRRSFDLLIHVPRITVWTSETNAWLADERKQAAG